MATNNGWNEYSKLVLKELESLNDSVDSISEELQEVKKEIIKIQVREDKVIELRQWKERIDDVASPTQLKNYIVNIEELKIFRTKAITIFAVVQFAMAAVIWIVKTMG